MRYVLTQPRRIPRLEARSAQPATSAVRGRDRRHAERGQSQEQPLCEQGLQNGVRRQLENELGDDRSSVQRLHYLEEQFRKVSGGLPLRLERPGDAGQGLLGDRAKDGSNARLRNGNGSWSGRLPAPWRACAG